MAIKCFSRQSFYDKGPLVVVLAVWLCIHPPSALSLPLRSDPVVVLLANIRSSINGTISHLQDCLHTYLDSERLDFPDVVQLVSLLNSSVYPPELHFENLPFHGNISLVEDPAEDDALLYLAHVLYRDMCYYEAYFNLIIDEEAQILSQSESMTDTLTVARDQGIGKVKGDMEALLRVLHRLTAEGAAGASAPSPICVPDDDIIPATFKDARQQHERIRHFLDYLVLHRCKLYMMRIATVMDLNVDTRHVVQEQQ